MAPNALLHRLRARLSGTPLQPLHAAPSKAAAPAKAINPTPALVSASPAPPIITTPLTRAQLEAAIAKYGPTISLHPDEKYVNTSIEWYLSHATLVDTTLVAPAGRIVHPTVDQLPTGPGQDNGTRYELAMDDAAKAGDFSQAKAYVNAFWKPGMTYTDIQFWLFSGFNGHSTGNFESLVLDKIDHAGNVNLSPLGEHWADWEWNILRIDNTTQELIALGLSAHGGTDFYDTAAIKSKFKIVNGTHPVSYSSLNGHANFPSPGQNLTNEHKILGTPVGLEFNLVNATADGGLQFDCSTRYQVVSASWLNGTPDAYAIPNWVNYPYRWGPEGTHISMDTKSLGEILEALLGDAAKPLLHDPITELASWLLHVFVKQDMNGVIPPPLQAPWSGNY
ncbi:hypothetical protein G7Y89_g7314 [Cudoniella acicularis]|uniref:Uncharacterized protein n=1 Tax=Cudoniella acicularis TaxID=354080 RepID=A0A8H4RJK7_9HELO|nr:hypothetical protein G7Y89_g7314 [Cudoniella acicularis]